MSPSLTKHEIKLALAFYDVGRRQGRCAGCGYTGVFTEVHHVVPKSTLKRLLATKGKPTPPEVIWDCRNALLLCGPNAPNNCHEHHTNRSMPLSRTVVTAEAWAFAREHGLDWLFVELYPEPQVPGAA